jgi:hypothetical protein
MSGITAACSAASNFEITITAASYSQLAGLLAGFAFSALIFLVSTRIKIPDPQDSFASAVRTLIAAFLGLVLSSLGYAVLAGEPSDAQTRSADTEPILGVGFAIAGALVIYAIVLTLDAAERLVQTPSKAHRQVSSSTRHVLAAFVSPLLVFYLYLAIQDYEATQYGACHGTEPLDWFGISLVIAQLAASWFFYPFMLGQRIQAKSWEVAVRTTAWTSRLLLLTAFASAVGYAYVDAYASPTKPISPAVPAACMAIITLAALGLTWQLAYTHDVR